MKTKIKCPTESSEAKELKKWCDFHPIAKKYIIHIPNEGKRHILVGKRLKAEGMRKGVSDYFLAYPSNGMHGMFIELKRTDKSVSRVTKEQKEWIDQQNAVGYFSVVAYGWEHAAKQIDDYLK